MSTAPAINKSTTHPEMYFHARFLGPVKVSGISTPVIGATVFLRQESDGVWYYNCTLCAEPVFNPKVGRTWARRRYFVARQQSASNDECTNVVWGPEKPTYEEVVVKQLGMPVKPKKVKAVVESVTEVPAVGCPSTRR